jgi:hypothetical protein
LDNKYDGVFVKSEPNLNPDSKCNCNSHSDRYRDVKRNTDGNCHRYTKWLLKFL